MVGIMNQGRCLEKQIFKTTVKKTKQKQSISGYMAQVCSQNGGEFKQEVGGWSLST